jgi:hypothetical protein
MIKEIKQMEIIFLIVMTIAMFMVFGVDTARKRRKFLEQQSQGKKNAQ